MVKLTNVFVIVATLILFALLAIAINFYYYPTNGLEMQIGKPTNLNTNSYSETILFSYDKEEPPYEIQLQIDELLSEFNDVRINEIATLGKPYHIETNVIFENNQTKIIMSGTYTDEENVLQNYEKELIFDFIITKNLSR